MTSEFNRTPERSGETPRAVDGRPSGPNQARETGAALESHYRFILWLVPAVERFPRNRKFLLGDRIQTTALDVLERLIEATYIKRREGYLAAANLGLEKLRFLFRLARDLRALGHRRYEYAASILEKPEHVCERLFGVDLVRGAMQPFLAILPPWMWGIGQRRNPSRRASSRMPSSIHFISSKMSLHGLVRQASLYPSLDNSTLMTLRSNRSAVLKNCP